MANPEHLDVLQQSMGKGGMRIWNNWREGAPGIMPDLSGEFLSDAFLYHANLSGANLSGIVLLKANLNGANLRGANLENAVLIDPLLIGADLSMAANLRNVRITGAEARRANFSHSVLEGGMLHNADLNEAVMRNVNLRGAILTGARLLKTDLSGSDLTGAYVYGVSAWDITLDGTLQSDLVIGDIKQIKEDRENPAKMAITTLSEPTIAVDDLEVAQFIYLLLNNKKIGKVINTITSKAVLILGRFAPDRKSVLDAIREELRRVGYLPILFDFDPAISHSRMETVSTLAHLARFVIADITDAKTVLQELRGIVPGSPTLPVQPILLSGQKETGLFEFFRLYPWFLPTVYYDSPKTLLENLRERVIEPAERRALEILYRLDAIRSTP
jgi:hypothetical protein